MMRTFCPGWIRPLSRRPCSAARAEMGTAAACSKVRFAGLGQLVLRGERVLGEGPLGDPEHLLARPEPGHVLADGLHNPGHIRAGDAVLRLPQPESHRPDQVRPTRHQVPHARIHAGSADLDQHLVVTGGRSVDLVESQHVCRAVGVLHDRLHLVSPSLSGYWNTSSSGTSNTRAIRKAISSDGEYRPCSMAMTVCRVTPIRSASSAWVISPWANRRARIELETLVGLTTAGSLSGRR